MAIGRLAGIDGQLNGGANLPRGQSIQVGAQVVVRVPWRSKPSGGGLCSRPRPPAAKRPFPANVSSSVGERLAWIIREMRRTMAFRYAKVPVLQGIMGLL